MIQRPYVESADQNKEVIAGVLQKLFANSGGVLELGAGTGQHARYFASSFPHLNWLPTEMPDQLSMLERGVVDSGFNNLQAPVGIDVSNSLTYLADDKLFEYMYTANTLHIMSWQSVLDMIVMIEKSLKTGGVFVSYGPYNVDGQYTSESNQRFNQWLKNRNIESGIRDITDLNKAFEESNIELTKTIEMPVNNKILVWRKGQ